MGTNTKRGYITLEAAVFLPIFILGILTLGYLIKVYSTAENITFSMIDETGHLAAQAYGRKAAPLFVSKLENRLKKENQRLNGVSVMDFRYLYKERKRTGIITVSCKYDIDVSMPLEFWDEVSMESRLKCRGFIGLQRKTEPMSFESMERNGNSNIVRIFPMWGKKFHGEECVYVRKNAVQMVLTPQLKKQYQSCKRCRPDSMAAGTYVYCFRNAGKAYHTGDCKLVEKYTIEMEKKDAMEKGYRACSKCRGK